MVSNNGYTSEVVVDEYMG